MEENKNKGVNSIIVVLLIITVLGLAGFICYDKFIKTESNSKSQAEQKSNSLKNESLDPQGKEVTDLLNKLFSVNNYKEVVVGGTSRNAYESLMHGFDVNNISDEDMAGIISSYMFSKNDNIEYIKEDDMMGTKEISVDTFKKYVLEFFGDDYKYIKPTKDTNSKSCGTFVYSLESDSYGYNTHCGGRPNLTYFNKVANAIKNDNEIIINLNVFKAEYSYIPEISAGQIDISANKSFRATVSENNGYKEAFDKYNDYSENYTLIFRKHNENYYIKTIYKTR